MAVSKFHLLDTCRTIYVWVIQKTIKNSVLLLNTIKQIFEPIKNLLEPADNFRPSEMKISQDAGYGKSEMAH